MHFKYDTIVNYEKLRKRQLDEKIERALTEGIINYRPVDGIVPVKTIRKSSPNTSISTPRLRYSSPQRNQVVRISVHTNPTLTVRMTTVFSK